MLSPFHNIWLLTYSPWQAGLGWAVGREMASRPPSIHQRKKMRQRDDEQEAGSDNGGKVNKEKREFLR